MKTPNYVFDDELYHHGILGQRWGHRRFQNEDGSWTPEGRERYGEGDGPRQAAKPKVDARAKARASFEEKKYKMYMKSKEQRLKDKIAAKEERNRVREAAKTEKLARKEQAKIDKKMAVVKGTKLGKTKNMSDDDLQTAINRLKLEVEYNKNYAIASKPNSALARADRFFEGPTGQVVKAVAVATLPKVAEQFVSKTLESNLKYANKLDRDKQIAEIKKQKADTEKVNAETRDKIQSTRNAKLESENKIKLDNEKAAQEKLNSDREFEQQKRRDENEYKLNKFDRQLEYKKSSAQSHRDDLKVEGEQKRLDELQRAEQARLDSQQKHDEEMDTKKKTGYSDRFNNWITGDFEREASKHTSSLKNEALKRDIEEKNAQLERDIKEAESSARISAASHIQRNIAYMAEHNIPGQAEYERNASGALHASLSIMSDPKVNSKPVSSLSFAKDDFLSNAEKSSIKSATGTIEEIAKRFGVSPSTVSRIRS